MAIKIKGNTIIEDTQVGINVSAFGFADGTSFDSLGSKFGEYTTGLGSLLWTLDDPNAYSTSNGDRFGYSVAISGNYAIVCAYQESDMPLGTNSGKAYIFNVTTGQLVHTLNNPNAYGASEYDRFGISVAISGNYAIVGAYQEDDGPNGSSSGKAYIFNVTTGQLVHALNNPNAYNTGNFDYFGEQLAISGNYAIVSAIVEDDVNGTTSGKVYIFNVTTGQLVWTLSNPNPYDTSANDTFGNSVSISGNYVIVGAYQEDDIRGSQSGKAYIYNVTTGQLVWTLNNPNAYSSSTGDFFGKVSISGNYAIVGARYESDAGGVNSGKAYIFNVTTGQLIRTLNNPNAYGTATTDYFGEQVSISGNYAIISAYNEESGSGRAYIYNVTTGELIYTLNNPNAYGGTGSDNFGRIAISGNYAIVGAYLEDDGASGSESGKAYIFTLAPTTDFRYVEEIEFANGTTVNFLADKAFQTAYVPGQLVWTLDNPNSHSTPQFDAFGQHTAISGNYAIVGASGESNPGSNVRYSGAAYIFNVTTGQLVHTLTNPDTYVTASSDNFSTNAVAISGNYAIVGAKNEYDSSTAGQSGKAYIFNVTTGQLVWILDNPNYFSTANGDLFGASVAISGNYAIVGAFDEDDAGGLSSGKAYIFNVTTGQLLHALSNPNYYDTSENDVFGSSVAISGNYAIVSANGEDELGNSNSGKAYIFNVITGQLLHALTNPNYYEGNTPDYFGAAVAIDGNYAIVGAPLESDGDGVTGAYSGKAYIFNVTTGQLLHALDNPNFYSTSYYNIFGAGVGISGNYAIVAAPYESDGPTGNGSGVVYVFDVTTGALVYRLNNPNAFSTGFGDGFGSCAISGNYAIVGAQQEDETEGDDTVGQSSGKAYIFSVTHQTYLDKIITVGNSIF